MDAGTINSLDYPLLLSMQRVAPLCAIDLLLLASLLFLFAVGVASVPNNPHRFLPATAKKPNDNVILLRAATQPSTKKAQKWFPLESNPVLMNDYIEKLGFHSDLYNFVDVFATEEWALSMIPQPVVAVIFLYPLTEKQLQHESGKTVAPSTSDDDNKIWFIKQRIGNACGTIGLLHALLNTPEPVSQFRPGSWLQQFQASCPVSLDPVAKAEILEADDTIATLHDKATSSEQNSTDRGRLDDQLVTHFIAFVRGTDDNTLYELDGRKAGPVPHGTTSATTLLPDACRVIKEFMARDPTEVRFTILALAPKVEE